MCPNYAFPGPAYLQQSRHVALETIRSGARSFMFHYRNVWLSAEALNPRATFGRPSIRIWLVIRGPSRPIIVEVIPSLICTGSFDYDDGVNKTVLLAHLAEKLRSVNAASIRVSSNAVSFTGGLFRGVNNWNILIPFGRGELIADDAKHEIHYRLNVRQLVYSVGIMFAFASVTMFSVIRDDPAMLLVFALGCLWLIGGNLLIGLPRFKRFLRDAIDTVPVETTQQQIS